MKFVRIHDDVVDTAIVPGKREIATGTLRSILHQDHIALEVWDRL